QKYLYSNNQNSYWTVSKSVLYETSLFSVSFYVPESLSQIALDFMGHKNFSNYATLTS
ncbi:MAG: hypothetical protein FD167_3954, partial [bacterium]